MLNIKCFKKFCLVAATKQSKILYDYYIIMEEINIKLFLFKVIIYIIFYI